MAKGRKLINLNFVKRVNKLKAQYIEFFKENPEDVFTSPGRVELLGNHTDHNHGKVLVSSIDLNILALSKKTDERKIVYWGEGFPLIEIDIDDLDNRPSDYGQSTGMVRGVLYKMKELGYNIGGLHIGATTSIFKGAGVSSSAAFEILIAKMISYYYNNDSISPFTLAQIGQFAESVYFNKPCGLLDQSGIALGAINYIDFNDVDAPIIKNVSFNIKGYSLILVNTKDSHSALTPLYAKIKNDMFDLAHYFNKDYLRQVNKNDFFDKKNQLIEKFGEDVYLRGKHYFEENERVEKAYDAIIKGDGKTLIQMMNESGESSYYQLKNCYVHSEEENLPKTILLSKRIISDGAVRVHGGGFAGTIIALINDNEAKDYLKRLRKIYGYNNVKRIAFNRYGTRFICKVEEV
ncbi:MAG: galactokinase family protein [Bacillales bacterium]|nr:galactokinase family protein [Bacillales bacterium]